MIPDEFERFKHVPTNVRPDQPQRCEYCGELWATCRGREAMKQSDDEQAIVDMIDVGQHVWKYNPHGPPEVGGTVVAWKVTWPLYEPGVLQSPTTTFTVLDFPQGKPRYFELNGEDIDVAEMLPIHESVVRSQARRLATIIGRNSGIVTEAELRDARTVHHLMQVIL